MSRIYISFSADDLFKLGKKAIESDDRVIGRILDELSLRKSAGAQEVEGYLQALLRRRSNGSMTTNFFPGFLSAQPLTTVLIPRGTRQFQNLVLGVGSDYNLGRAREFLETMDDKHLRGVFRTQKKRDELREALETTNRIYQDWNCRNRRSSRISWVLPDHLIDELSIDCLSVESLRSFLNSHLESKERMNLLMFV